MENIVETQKNEFGYNNLDQTPRYCAVINLMKRLREANESQNKTETKKLQEELFIYCNDKNPNPLNP